MPRKYDIARLTASVESDEPTVSGINAAVVEAVSELHSDPEMEQAHVESQEIHNEIADAGTAADRLGEVAEAMSAAAADRDGIDLFEVKLIRRRAEEVAQPLVEVVEPNLLVASQESFELNSTAALRISIESVGESIQKAYEWVIEKLKALGEAIVKFFTSAKSYNKRVLEKATALKAEVEKLKADADVSGKNVEITGPAQYAFFDKKHEGKVPVTAHEFRNSLNDVSNELRHYLKTGNKALEAKDILHRATEAAKKALAEKTVSFGKEDKVNGYGAFYKEANDWLTKGLESLGTQQKLFFRERDILATVPVVGGEYVEVSAPKVNTDKVEEKMGSALATKVAVKRATLKSSDPITVDLLDRETMDLAIFAVIEICKDAEDYYAEVESEAKSLEELRKEAEKINHELFKNKTGGYYRPFHFGNADISVVLNVVNASITLRKAMAKIASTSNVNVLKYVAKHVSAHHKLEEKAA